MPAFSIQRNATPLCTWDLTNGDAEFHSKVPHRDGMPVLSETGKVGFVLKPASEGVEYRIFVGDVSLIDIVSNPDDAGGVPLNGLLFWRDLAYFDSARGVTQLSLQSRSGDRPHEAWTDLLSEKIYVLPSKIGDERYEAMTSDLEKVSRSLLMDLYGKSHQTVDIRYARQAQAHHSHEQELKAIEILVSRLGPLLQSIGDRPTSRIRSAVQSQSYWGTERLAAISVVDLVTKGIDPRTSQRPIRFLSQRRTESFDVPEHRFIQAFLGVLVRRGRLCAEVSKRHVKAIEAEQHLRDIKIGTGPSLFETMDRPRIKRLSDAVETAERSVLLVHKMRNLPFLKDVPAEFKIPKAGLIHRNLEYQSLFAMMRRFLVGNAVWYSGQEFSVVTKLTWRIFEQWTFLHIVDSFRRCGVELREWNDALRHNLRSRFIIDFDRGMAFEGILDTTLRIRFRYEPWIKGHSTALQVGETLCRGTSGEVAWCPDIVIECLKKSGQEWQPIYAIVLDCKYSHDVTDQQWGGITKYLEIRSTKTKSQIVKQLWIVCPAQQSEIKPKDPVISFSENGPSCGHEEVVHFQLNVSPGELARESSGTPSDTFTTFARGTIQFIRRYISAGSKSSPS